LGYCLTYRDPTPNTSKHHKKPDNDKNYDNPHYYIVTASKQPESITVVDWIAEHVLVQIESSSVTERIPLDP
jgi:hypothetical protein